MVDENDMREQLVGYALDALDDDERRAVEAALADPRCGTDLRRDLEAVRSALAPLARDRNTLQAPAGLATRTLAFVATQTVPEPQPTLRPLSPAEDSPRPRGRVWLDRALIVATALAACVLVLPLLPDIIMGARERRKERNLQVIAGALQGYEQAHGFFPTPPSEGPLSRAGLYAPTLVSERRLVADDGTVLVPGSALSRRGNFRVPSLEELEAAVGTPRFDELVRDMGGDFGYTLGVRDAAGVLQFNRNHHRRDHPLLADDPDQTDEKSDNDPDGIHHILFEDGHIERRTAQELHRDGDHLYRNEDGEAAAADDPNDAVIGDSEDKP